MVVMVSRGRGLNIAGLTAAGQTNCEIAQRLYMACDEDGCKILSVTVT